MEVSMRARMVLVVAVAMAAGLFSFACGGGGGAASPPPSSPITVALSLATLEVYRGGEPALVDVTVTRPAGTSRSVTLTAPLLPAGVTAEIESPGDGNQGTITFTAAALERVLCGLVALRLLATCHLTLPSAR
jgi:hypothetical protein